MEELKKCPYCNSEMAFGYIQSPRVIIWSKKKHKMCFIPDENQGDVLLKRENLLGLYKQAYHCANCETIIIRNDD